MGRLLADPTLAGICRSRPSCFGEGRFTLRLWNAATHQMIAELPLDDRCGGLAFARDGRTLVTSTGHSLVLCACRKEPGLRPIPVDKQTLRPQTVLPQLPISAWQRMDRRGGSFTLLT